MMNNEKITFSVDIGILSKKDVEDSSEMAEEFFEMESKPDEMPASEENQKFVLEKIPECDNVIRENGKIIGFTFIIPCNKDIMERFLSNKISERELFEEVKLKINYENFDTIYLCSSFIKEEYRGKGLAIQGNVKSIRKIIADRNIKPILFSWAQTKEGEKSVKRTAKELGFELRIK